MIYPICATQQCTPPREMSVPRESVSPENPSVPSCQSLAYASQGILFLGTDGLVIVERPDPCNTRPYAKGGPTASTALFFLPRRRPLPNDVLFCLRLTPCVAVRSQRCLFSLRVACAVYLASLLPVYAACAACRLALFSNGAFRVCVRIN
jgi:hypothetical protein